MDQHLLTVSQLAREWNCSEDFIYRRCRKGHPHYIPHTRLTPRDIRFDRGVISGYLQSVTQDDNLSSGSAVRGGCVTRNRDRKGTLLKRGKKRKLYLVQWSQGSERLSHKLGWCDEMTKSSRTSEATVHGDDQFATGRSGGLSDADRILEIALLG